MRCLLVVGLAVSVRKWTAGCRFFACCVCAFSGSRARRGKIRPAAEGAARRWRKSCGVTVAPAPIDTSSPTYQTLPRPPDLGVTRATEPALPPRGQGVQFRVGRFQAAWRLLLWFYAAAH